MRFIRTMVSGLCAVILGSHALMAVADEGATKEQAVSMVKKGVTFLKANGPDKTYAAFTDKANADFHDRDLYLTVYNFEGKVLAHGANPKMIGRDMIGLKDVDGKEFVKERVEFAKTKASFWQDYKFTNPVNKKIEPKSMYCEKVDVGIVCGGIYK